jgi:exopolyphosphatase / guanosine-5'-triphosphate,3'-diphosphate pyrophosphatase
VSEPVAAIDCGTNSLRLLIAAPGAGRELIELDRRTEIVRLGQGVDSTGAFAAEALQRTFGVLEEYARRLADAGVEPDRLRMVATSAARDVSNRDAFVAGVERRVGVRPEVISGDREARLSFAGALSSRAVRRSVTDQGVLLVDIGGGSTELVFGSGDGRVDAAVSLPMGSVRLTERFLADSPPSTDELAGATTYVDDLLDGSGLDWKGVRSLVGVAGTVVTLAWLAGAAPADPHGVPGCVVSRADFDRVLRRLGRLTAEQIRAIPGMHPGRADVITAGALIAARIMARAPGVGLVVSIADILDGLVLELTARRPSEALPATRE